MRGVVGFALAVLMMLLTIPAEAEPGFSSTRPLSPVHATGGKDDPYSSIACPDASDCVAVGPNGDQYGISGGVPTVVSEHRGTWSSSIALALPAGGNGQGSTLKDVVCLSAGNCELVGELAKAEGTLPLVASEASGTWQAASTVPLPSGDSSGGFDGIWCATTDDCIAAGTGVSSTLSFNVIIAMKSSGNWSQASTLPSAPSDTLAFPTSISCVDLSDCSLFGIGISSGQGESFVWNESAGIWGAPMELRQPPGKNVGFDAFSGDCPSQGSCIAVGGLGVGSSVYLAATTESNGKWSVVRKIPDPELSPVMSQGYLQWVSCSGPSQCTAVGLIKSNDGDVPSIAASVTWHQRSWGSVGVVQGVRVGSMLAASSFFTSISCPTLGSCTGIGAGLAMDSIHATAAMFAARVSPLRVISAPGAPSAVLTKPIARGVNVSWTPPTNDGGSPVSFYRATTSPGGSHCIAVHLHCTIDGLVTGRTYRVSIRDTTAGGTSPPRVSAPFIAK